ncbi:MAG: hypothetical protein AB1592_15850 [Pseudomonadota bacterium]
MAEPTYDPSATYTVVLSRPVVIGGLKLLPRNTNTMTGAALNRLIENEGDDAIISADPVAG